MKGKQRIPLGPAQEYSSTQDLLGWLDAHCAQYGDIYRATVYGSKVYVVNAPDYAEHVLLRNWQNYPRKGQAVTRIALSLGSGLISSNGEVWMRQRRMMQPAFNRDAIRALAGIIVEANRSLSKKWQQAARCRQRVNVTRDVSFLILEIVLRAIFGEDYAQVAPHFNIVAEESRNLEFAQTCSSLAKVIVQIAEQRCSAQRTGGDILGSVMQARDREGGQRMSFGQLAREILTLVVAGHETTASVLNWTWYLLAKHPEVEAKLSRELAVLSGSTFPEVRDFTKFSFTRQVIDEALRLYPPLWLMTRKATRDDYLGEYFVPAGTEIYISPYLIQRHPSLWEEPQRFDPERFNSGADRPSLAACPFGAGPRNCIGEFFARTEMQIHLMLIAKDLRLRYDDTKPAEMAAGMNLLSRKDFIMAPELKVAGPDLEATPAVLIAQTQGGDSVSRVN